MAIFVSPKFGKIYKKSPKWQKVTKVAKTGSDDTGPHTAGWWHFYYFVRIWKKTIPTKVSAVLDTYRYAKLAGTKKFAGFV